MSITAMTCPKCKSAMHWYSAGGYGFNPQWKCGRCGYDTANQTYRTSNRTECGMNRQEAIDGDNQRFEAAVEEAIRCGFITEQLAMPEPGEEGGE